jgi:hypothetical protein
MTTLELELDDDLQAFVLRQSRSLGHPSAAVYIKSLLSLEKLRQRSPQVEALLKEAETDQTEPVDDAYWKRLESEIFGESEAEENP